MMNLKDFLVSAFLGTLIGSIVLHGTTLAKVEKTALEENLQSLQGEWQKNHREHAKRQQKLHASAERIRTQLCEMGESAFCKAVDLWKLAHAVAFAETEDCRMGVGRSKNNCHGIKRRGQFVSFASKEESYMAFQDIWLRLYGNRFPTIEDAQRYTANENPSVWYGIVTKIYNQ